MSSIGRFRLAAAVAGLGVLHLLCASVALADATSSKTYWVTPNGSDDADCLSKETAGSVWKGWCIITNNFKGLNASTMHPDTLVFCEGEYDFTKLTPGFLRLYSGKGAAYLAGESHDVLIKSENENPKETILKGAGKGLGARAFFISGQATISGFTFEDFDATTLGVDDACCGGAIHSHKNQHVIGSGWAQGSVNLKNCIFRNNYAVHGGAVAYTQSGGVKYSISNCVFTANNATKTCGGVYTSGGGSFEAVKCAFTNNYAGSGSMAVMTTGSATGTARDLDFVGNRGAGAVYNVVSASVVTNCTFISNKTSRCVYADNNKTELRRCVFVGNTGTESWGSCVLMGNCRKCAFTNNCSAANGNAYGIYCASSGSNMTYVDGCDFYGNYASPTTTIYGCAVSAGANGGCSLTVCNSTFISNFTQRIGYGSATVYYGTLCENCYFEGNGAGLNPSYNSVLQEIHASACTFVSNTVAAGGLRATGNGRGYTNCLFVAETVEANNNDYWNCTFINGTVGFTKSGVARLMNCAVDGGLGGNWQSFYLTNCAVLATAKTQCKVNGSTDWYDTIEDCRELLEAADSKIVATDAAFKFLKDDIDIRAFYAPKRRSPLVAAGRYYPWMTEDATDILGRPRSIGGIVDIGCCAYAPKASGLMLLLR